jgi:dipeptidase
MKTITVIAVFWLLIESCAYPCSTIIVGKDASADGSVLLGHNEDDDGLRVVNIWRVERTQHTGGDSIQLVSGIRIPQVSQTWAYLWFQMSGLAYADLYMNEWGVTVASNSCPSKLENRVDPGGIGYWLRRLIVERAQSAREGIYIAQGLLDSLGYEDYGRTLVVCDPNEGWLISMLGGKYWAACKVPDKGVVVIPNQFVVRGVDFKNKKDWKISKLDFKVLADSNSWIESESNTEFDFRQVFAKDEGKDLRQWRVQNLVMGKEESVMGARPQDLPFAVYPKTKVTLKSLMKILRDHFEGTKYALQDSAGISGVDTAGCCGMNTRLIRMNPNISVNRTLCTYKTQYSVIAQLRNWLPWPAGGVLWVSFGRPDCHPYIPWYAALDSVPGAYQNFSGISDPQQALDSHFTPQPETFDYNPRSAFWIFNELENITDMDYYQSIERVRPVRDSIENRIIDFQSDFESSLLRLWKKDPESTGRYCRELLESATEESLKKSIYLIQMLKTTNFR